MTTTEKTDAEKLGEALIKIGALRASFASAMKCAKQLRDICRPRTAPEEILFNKVHTTLVYLDKVMEADEKSKVAR